ncbi:MAG: O-antigen ligase domain-containing protein [Deltaproteobacteria bacterium]|nr:MAG: O-antigen ligase domain-containing protein [Deltaproteobacteria bacterium]
MARVSHDWGHRDRELGRVRARFDVARLPDLALATAIIGAPLAFGGVHVVSKIALAAVVVAGFIIHATLLQRGGTQVRVGWVGLALLAALAWSVLQWIPLPAGLVELLAPASHQARVLAAEAVGGVPPAWESLSVDGARSAAAVVALMMTTFGYLLALNLWDNPTGRARAAIYVEVAALATLAVGGLHAALGLDHLYGFYEASIPLTDRLFPTPFVNANHAGALFLLASVVAFGRWLDADRDTPWHLAAGVAASVGVLATFSRANALLWGAGLVLLSVVAFRHKERPQVRVRYLRLVVGALAIGVVAVILIGPDRWLGEMATLTDVGEPGQGGLFACWDVGLQLALGHPVLGAGNGAFEVLAPTVMSSWDVGLVAYAHNGALQVLAELGLVVGGGVLLLAAAGFVRLVYRARRSVAALASAVGILVLLAQNLVDFSLWLPGVGLAAVAVLGTIGSAGISRKKAQLHVRWSVALSITVTGLLVLTALHAWRGRPDAGYAAARVTMAGERDPGELSVASAALVQAHPSDYYAYHLGAALAAADGDEVLALRLLDRAHALAPTEPNVAARRAALLIDDAAPPATLGADLERLAAEGRPGLERALDVVLRPRADKGVVEGFLGADPERIVAASRRLATSDAAEHLLTWGLERHPDSLTLIEELGHRWSGRRDRIDVLERLATDLLARVGAADEGLDPAERRGWARAAYLFQGTVLKLRGEPKPAWHMFIEAADQDEKKAEAPLILAGDAAVAMGRMDLLAQAVGRLALQPLDNPWPRSRLHHLSSILAEKKGDLRGAIREMQRALGALSQVDGYEDRLATLFDQVGEPNAAAAARRRAEDLRAKARERDATPK